MSDSRKTEIEEYFSKLPSERERGYEMMITKLAEKCTGPQDVDALRQILADASQYSYMAFQCLLTLHRRNKDFEQMKLLFEEHPEFKKHISYNHFLVQYLVHSESFYDYEDLLLMSYKDTQLFEDNAGYHQAFCNAFATICECCNEEDRDRIIEKWWDEAFSSINKAISLDDRYAKFYCTKGRILSLCGKYSEAINLINKAISLENSSRPDYAMTIMNYQINKMQVQFRQQQAEMNSRIQSLESMLQTALAQLPAGSASLFDADDDSEEQLLEAYTGQDSYAFVSYAHKDQDEVYEIIQDMQKRKARIWFDKGLELGKEWPEEIATHLVNSSVVLVMLSSNSIQSANVRREVNLALSEGKDLIVIRLDDFDLSPGMKLQFGVYQMILKWTLDTPYFNNMLSKAINRRLELS